MNKQFLEYSECSDNFLPDWGKSKFKQNYDLRR